MKKLTFIATLFTAVIFASCGGDSGKAAEEQTIETANADPESYDPKRGQGKFTAELLALTDKLDETKAKAGEAVSLVKCTSCHKMTDEKLVGPGWKSVTTRRAPDPMLDKDPEAQAMLELCLVRMPNQNLADEEARNLLEFMRKNDGLK